MTIFSEDFLDPRFSFLDILILCNFIIKREKIRLVGAGIYVDGIRVKMEDGGKKLIDWNFFAKKKSVRSVTNEAEKFDIYVYGTDENLFHCREFVYISRLRSKVLNERIILKYFYNF